MAVVVVLLILCFVFIVCKWWMIKSHYWVDRNTIQVEGLMWKYITGNKSLPEIVKDIYYENPELPYVGTYFGIKPTLILRDTRNIYAVLHSDFQSFYERGIHSNATDILSDNLFFIDDYKRWKLIRHNVSSVLNTKNLNDMFNSTERCAKDFVKYLTEYPEIRNDPYQAIYQYITACISSVIFGVDEHTTENMMQTKFSSIAHTMSKPSWLFNMKFVIFHFSPGLYKLLRFKVFADLEDHFIQLLKEAILKRRKGGGNIINYDFIQTCLNLEDIGVLRDPVSGYETKSTVEFLAAQAFGFFIGGVDTSTSVLHFTLSELSRNTKLLQKVHEEIDEVFRNSEGPSSLEDLDKLKYIGMVFNETMRKYPPVGAMHRKCSKNTVLPVGNLTVEKDTVLFIPILALHYDKKYFPDPEVFDPERFSEENISKIAKYTYLPFCDGKRKCIGRRLAFLQLKLGLVWLLQKYTVVERPGTQKRFEPNIFILRDPTAHYRIISRSLI